MQFKTIIFSHVFKTISSFTININCMPYVNYGSNVDVIICKWESNGIPYYDDITTASTDCIKIGYFDLEGLGYYTLNNKNITERYIISSECNKYKLKKLIINA
jgi:hypothetical protein